MLLILPPERQAIATGSVPPSGSRYINSIPIAISTAAGGDTINSGATNTDISNLAPTSQAGFNIDYSKPRRLAIRFAGTWDNLWGLLKTSNNSTLGQIDIGTITAGESWISADGTEIHMPDTYITKPVHLQQSDRFSLDLFNPTGANITLNANATVIISQLLEEG